MTLDLPRARTMVFDCDGVVLDSNRLKTEAFRMAAQPYGNAAAQALVDYHVANGGVSRYVKFAHFLDHIVPEQAGAAAGPGMDGLLATYAEAVRAGLMTCPVADGLAELRAATPQARWMVVSGGDQAELRAVFAARGIAGYFDGGIFGSPDTKDAILARESKVGTVRHPAVLLGDSRLDHDAATRAGLDFLFVADWSEWSDGARLASEGRFATVRSLVGLLEA